MPLRDGKSMFTRIRLHHLKPPPPTADENIIISPKTTALIHLYTLTTHNILTS